MSQNISLHSSDKVLLYCKCCFSCEDPPYSASHWLPLVGRVGLVYAWGSRLRGRVGWVLPRKAAGSIAWQRPPVAVVLAVWLFAIGNKGRCGVKQLEPYISWREGVQVDGWVNKTLKWTAVYRVKIQFPSNIGFFSTWTWLFHSQSYTVLLLTVTTKVPQP